MRSLLALFFRFGHIILFLLLEIACFVLVVRYNDSQKEIWINSSNILSGFVSDQWNNWTSYFGLKETAGKLARENAYLTEQLLNVNVDQVKKDSFTTKDGQYSIILAKAINISTHRPNNHITLNKGRKQGIRPGMGVINGDGIVGIVRAVSENFASVIAIIHRQSSIVASIKRTGAFGQLKWMNSNPRYIGLQGIEKHHSVEIGDTIETSGFSTHFPPGLIIGEVAKVDLPRGSNFYDINVLLSNDFSTLKYVYVINNFKQQEQLDLEKEVSNE